MDRVLFGVCLACVIVLGVISRNVRVRSAHARGEQPIHEVRPGIAGSCLFGRDASGVGGLVAAESATAFGKNKTYTPVFEYPALAAHQRYDSTRIERLVAAESLSVDSVATKRQELHSPGYFLRAFWDQPTRRSA
jgi:hypothetical protein